MRDQKIINDTCNVKVVGRGQEVFFVTGFLAVNDRIESYTVISKASGEKVIASAWRVVPANA